MSAAIHMSPSGGGMRREDVCMPSTHTLGVCCAVRSRLVLSESVTLWTVARQASLSMRILQARILEWVAMTSSRGYS